MFARTIPAWINNPNIPVSTINSDIKEGACIQADDLRINTAVWNANRTLPLGVFYSLYYMCLSRTPKNSLFLLRIEFDSSQSEIFKR